ncbi:MAG: DUF4230 domain-containing protein [Acidobacteria bacterium]|nr:MAG: DUF4230 domain-containing protein [Acidobacteriota bacterium]PYY06502.1 MAG: DUF4230 domain-containing protein [Acidobacteriota bacterium]PYY24094.1 MAG: DUF4230 domain-containing protein [Acidobacteriota bacterium]
MSILPTDNLRAPSRLGRLGIFLAGFVTAVFLLFLVSYPAGRGRWLQRVLHVDLDQPAIVQRIQRLQRLESVKYTLEKVVTGERQSRFLPQSLAGERLLLIVRGEVFAGVDLGKLQSSDVQVNGKQVKISLPRAEIFSTRVDNNQTRVYSRETGLLVPADPNLESEVRAEAERQLLQAALIDGILNNASTNARGTVTALVQALGFTDVEVN